MRTVYRQDLQTREGLADLLQFADIATERTDQIVDGRIAPSTLSARDGILETSQDIIIYRHQRDLLHTSSLCLLNHLFQTVRSIEHSIIDQTGISQFQLLGGETLATARSTRHNQQILLTLKQCFLQHLLVGRINNQILGLLIVVGIRTGIT